MAQLSAPRGPPLPQLLTVTLTRSHESTATTGMVMVLHRPPGTIPCSVRSQAGVLGPALGAVGARTNPQASLASLASLAKSPLASPSRQIPGQLGLTGPGT